jgi:hypothetical protein
MKLVRAPGELWRQWDPETDDPMDADVETMDVEPCVTRDARSGVGAYGFAP